MRVSTKELVCLALLVLPASSPAEAALTISAAPTANMLCSGHICSPTGNNAVLNVVDLQNLLATKSIKVTTTGSSHQATDIKISDALTWVSSNILTLDAYHSIIVNKPVTVTGSGGLTIHTDDGGTGGDLSFAVTGNVTFWSLTSSLKINNWTYILVSDIATLASDIAANKKGSYALAASYNAAADGVYASSPIATFRRRFEGLGNTISNLSINDTANINVGLFAQLHTPGTIHDINLVNVNVAGRSSYSIVGALVGGSNGQISRSYVQGSVQGSIVPDRGTTVGGLVGTVSGEVENSGANVSVAAGDYGVVGGLVGLHIAGEISQSTARGTVSAGGNSTIGGLVGSANRYTYITGSSASSSVTGGDNAQIGGLIGIGVGTIDHSIAHGNVSGGSAAACGESAMVGGLAGLLSEGSVANSYATGKVVAGNCTYVGGLVGFASVTPITGSYATGNVKGGQSVIVGGLVGDLATTFGTNGVLIGMVTDSYATGAVESAGNSKVGGLVGVEDYEGSAAAAVISSYSTGVSTGKTGSIIGGLVGFDGAPTGKNSSSYWDTTTSGISSSSQGAGSPANDPGITGLTTTQLQSGLPAGFDPSIWSENPSINGGLPYLLANPPT